jgi:hypothetical protein
MITPGERRSIWPHSSGGEHGSGGGTAGPERQRSRATVVVAAEQVQRQPLLDPPDHHQLLFPPLHHGHHHLPPPPLAGTATPLVSSTIVFVVAAVRRPVLGSHRQAMLLAVRRGGPVPLERVAAQEHPPGAVVLVPEAPSGLRRLLLLGDLPVQVIVLHCCCLCGAQRKAVVLCGVLDG